MVVTQSTLRLPSCYRHVSALKPSSPSQSKIDTIDGSRGPKIVEREMKVDETREGDAKVVRGLLFTLSAEDEKVFRRAEGSKKIDRSD